MTVTIHLPPEVEADMQARARASGLPLPAYLQRLLREQFTSTSGAQLSPAQRAAAWRASSEGLPVTPPLSDRAISRESIYEDRGR